MCFSQNRFELSEGLEIFSTDEMSGSINLFPAVGGSILADGIVILEGKSDGIHACMAGATVWVFSMNNH